MPGLRGRAAQGLLAGRRDVQRGRVLPHRLAGDAGVGIGVGFFGVVVVRFLVVGLVVWLVRVVVLQVVVWLVRVVVVLRVVVGLVVGLVVVEAGRRRVLTGARSPR